LDQSCSSCVRVEELCYLICIYLKYLYVKNPLFSSDTSRMDVASVRMSRQTRISRHPCSLPPSAFAPPHARTSPCLCAHRLPLTPFSLFARVALRSRNEQLRTSTPSVCPDRSTTVTGPPCAACLVR
jgi:hypothetical protein